MTNIQKAYKLGYNQGLLDASLEAESIVTTVALFVSAKDAKIATTTKTRIAERILTLIKD